MQIFESKNKPIVDKDRNIYYRYPGTTEKIQKQDLQEILKEQMGKDMMPTLSKHIEQIFKNGIENSAILNIVTGDVEGKSGNFLIDKTLLPKIAFIKEGEFVETKGTPALVLKGEVKAYNALVKEKEVQGIDDNDVFQCFFENRDLAQEVSKEYLNQIASSSIELFPMRFFAQKAGMDKEKIIKYLKDYKGGRKIEKKIKKLEENQPERLKIANTIECKKLKKENFSNLTGRDRDIEKWLTSIQSYDEQTIRKEKDFLLELIQKLYDYCSANETQYKNLLSQIRKTIAYLDRILYPLD